MTQQVSGQETATEVVISSSIEKEIDRKQVLKLLRTYRVNIRSLSPEVNLKEIIPFLHKGKIKIPESFFKALSRKLFIPFVSFKEIREIFQEEQKSRLIAVIPYALISKYKIIPIDVRERNLDLAVDNPLDEKVMVTIRYLFSSWKVHLHVASSQTIDWAIENIYSLIHKKTALLDLYNRTPDQSAHKVLYPQQKFFLIATLLVIFFSFLVNSMVTFLCLFAMVSVGYFIFNPIKIYVSLRGFKGAREPAKVEKDELEKIEDNDLPIYTVLVPIYHEAPIMPRLLRNIYKLNYPKNKLDVKILMEENDKETISRAHQLGLFGSPKETIEGIGEDQYASFVSIFDPIVIPAGQVMTKPRACNYGLLRAKGDLCVIYDAEDDPDPNQLRKAAIVFQHVNQNIVCLQSKLNFYNADENILTKWFSIEYANWYEFYLQGLDWIDAPIPLGGTSNHFRKKDLDVLGRWDPYNVTEDADIGIRLARRNLKTEIIDSYTYEEAPIGVKSWVKQRSRWCKGHLQTYLVHMRHPKKLLSDMGLAKFTKFQVTFGASVIIPIINPMLWIFTAVSFLLPINFVGLTPGLLQSINLFNLIVGNTSYLLIYAIACSKLKKYRYLPYAFLMPFYWVLLSIASWRGLIQLIRRPFYWDKTSHGISQVKLREYS